MATALHLGNPDDLEYQVSLFLDQGLSKQVQLVYIQVISKFSVCLPLYVYV